MKKNFRELTDTEIESFQPVFYMIMGKGGTRDGWQPMAWQPPVVDDENGDLHEGRLYWPDGSITPDHTDPLEVYEHAVAMQFIALDTLRRGMEDSGDGDKVVFNYRLVPVYTGFEKQLTGDSDSLCLGSRVLIDTLQQAGYDETRMFELAGQLRRNNDFLAAVTPEIREQWAIHPSVNYPGLPDS